LPSFHHHQINVDIRLSLDFVELLPAANDERGGTDSSASILKMGVPPHRCQVSLGLHRLDVDIQRLKSLASAGARHRMIHARSRQPIGQALRGCSLSCRLSN
jgi:hypothetical protein